MPDGLGQWKEYEFLPEELEKWITQFRGYPQHLWEKTIKEFVRGGRLSATQALQLARRLKVEQAGEVFEFARRRPEREEERAIPSRVPARTPEIEPYAPAAEKYYPFIEGLETPGMQSYYRRQYPYIFGQFGGEEAMEEAEVGRAEAIARAMRGVSGAKGRRDVLARRIEGPRPTLGGTVPRAQLGKAREQVRSRAEAFRRLRERTGKHPFEAYLEKYPFVKEFMKLPMRERGEYPSTYRPPTRWLGW